MNGRVLVLDGFGGGGALVLVMGMVAGAVVVLVVKGVVDELRAQGQRDAEYRIALRTELRLLRKMETSTSRKLENYAGGP